MNNYKYHENIINFVESSLKKQEHKHKWQKIENSTDLICVICGKKSMTMKVRGNVNNHTR